MSKTLVQAVTFATTPGELFEMYLDSDKHTGATGGEARLGRGEGDSFTAWDGYISGLNLRIVPGRLIVQAWRASEFKDSDPDSILVLSFDRSPKGATVTLVHANVPDSKAKSLNSGWHEHYWKPWKAWIAARAKPKAAPKKKR